MTDTPENKKCFLLPMNVTNPEYFWCPSLYEDTILKEYIDSIYYTKFQEKIDSTTIQPVSVPVMAENKYLVFIRPLLIIILIGILLLILLNIEIIYLLQHYTSRIRSQQRRNESVHYEEIRFTDYELQQNKEERSSIAMNKIDECRIQTTRL